MKRVFIILGFAAIFSAFASAQAQSTFQNLAFESANLPALPPGQYGGLVDINVAMPSWNAYLGGNSISQVNHNGITIGSASVDILGPHHFSSDILQGKYTVVLQAGIDRFSSGFQFVSAAIAQTGIVPATAQSLQFRVSSNPDGFLVSFATSSLSPVLLGTGANYQLYGVDISSFAGQSGELRFTAPTLENNPYNTFFLDAIQFSVQPVPEPSTFILTGLGALLLGVFCRRNSRRK